jgi:hypothetical protein
VDGQHKRQDDEGGGDGDDKRETNWGQHTHKTRAWLEVDIVRRVRSLLASPGPVQFSVDHNCLDDLKYLPSSREMRLHARVSIAAANENNIATTSVTRANTGQ